MVITVPAGIGSENHIVGENLLDFLCLGSTRGFFALAQLAYDWETTIEAYTNPNWVPTDSSQVSAGFSLGQNYRTAFVAGERFVDEGPLAILRLLVDSLNLKPWTDKSKFDRLKDRFYEELAAPTEPDW